MLQILKSFEIPKDFLENETKDKANDNGNDIK